MVGEGWGEHSWVHPCPCPRPALTAPADSRKHPRVENTTQQPCDKMCLYRAQCEYFNPSSLFLVGQEIFLSYRKNSFLTFPGKLSFMWINSFKISYVSLNLLLGSKFPFFYTVFCWGKPLQCLYLTHTEFQMCKYFFPINLIENQKCLPSGRLLELS